MALGGNFQALAGRLAAGKGSNVQKAYSRAGRPNGRPYLKPPSAGGSQRYGITPLDGGGPDRTSTRPPRISRNPGGGRNANGWPRNRYV